MFGGSVYFHILFIHCAVNSERATLVWVTGEIGTEAVARNARAKHGSCFLDACVVQRLGGGRGVVGGLMFCVGPPDCYISWNSKVKREGAV